MSKILIILLCLLPLPTPQQPKAQLVFKIKSRLDRYTMELAYQDYLNMLDNDCDQCDCCDHEIALIEEDYSDLYSAI